MICKKLGQKSTEPLFMKRFKSALIEQWNKKDRIKNMETRQFNELNIN